MRASKPPTSQSRHVLSNSGTGHGCAQGSQGWSNQSGRSSVVMIRPVQRALFCGAYEWAGPSVFRESRGRGQDRMGLRERGAYAVRSSTTLPPLLAA